jgi:hypothetical protein
MNTAPRSGELLAGHRIDPLDEVLQAHVERLDVLAGSRVEDVEQAFLAAGHDHAAWGAVDLDGADHPVEHPVEVVLVVLHVLEVPLELAGPRDEGEGGVGEQGVVVHAGVAVA